MQENMGSSKDSFCNLRVSLPGSLKYFREYLRENKKISKMFWDDDLGPRYYGFMKKSRAQKSHATVPLTGTNCKHCAKQEGFTKDGKYRENGENCVMLLVYFMFS